MSNFLTHIPPLGSALLSYDRSIPAANQPKTGPVPPAFMDAMAVRETVFVNEQSVPLDRELDSDDANSHHWVVYASVAVKSKRVIPLDEPLPPGAEGSPDSAPGRPGSSGRSRSNTESDRRRSSSGVVSPEGRSTIPVGTIRIVPPEGVIPVSSRRSSSAMSPNLLEHPAFPPPPSDNPLPHPTLYPNEPYIRFGRLATIPQFRGMGLSKLLISTALEYARKNPSEFSQTIDLPEVAAAIQEGTSTPEPWKGLVVVHAQRDRTVELWKKFGFQLDEGMGEWDEEGMAHVGMCLRLDVGRT